MAQSLVKLEQFVANDRLGHKCFIPTNLHIVVLLAFFHFFSFWSSPFAVCTLFHHIRWYSWDHTVMLLLREWKMLCVATLLYTVHVSFARCAYRCVGERDSTESAAIDAETEWLKVQNTHSPFVRVWCLLFPLHRSYRNQTVHFGNSMDACVSWIILLVPTIYECSDGWFHSKPI